MTSVHMIPVPTSSRGWRVDASKIEPRNSDASSDLPVQGKVNGHGIQSRFKSRHVQMNALGGAVGTGMTVSCGRTVVSEGLNRGEKEMEGAEEMDLVTGLDELAEIEKPAKVHTTWWRKIGNVLV